MFSSKSIFLPNISVIEIVASGTDVFLCQYDVTLVTATAPDSSILLYPNPSDGNITIEKIAPDATISMTDILGRKIDFEENILGASRKIKFEANSGSYFLKVLSKENNQVFKVVLK